jgi:Uncharacterized conserved protein (COG2071)
MRIPAIAGVIDRRILVNFHIDPEAMRRALPAPFRPKVVHGQAIGGICLIRLKDVRPAALPLPCGLRSENAAHRIAVEWDQDGQTREGVYIPRRDTDSRLNALVGGRVFPGVHHHATFECVEEEGRYSVSMASDDGGAEIRVVGEVTDSVPPESVFSTLDEASRFFEEGSLGYSDAHTDGEFDGLELRCEGWKVEALSVSDVHSSYFSDSERFPAGSVGFDCALLMRDIEHEWHSRESLCCPARS